jgi:hypothetical protein
MVITTDMAEGMPVFIFLISDNSVVGEGWGYWFSNVQVNIQLGNEGATKETIKSSEIKELSHIPVHCTLVQLSTSNIYPHS